jgi:hypothetical protein
MSGNFIDKLVAENAKYRKLNELRADFILEQTGHIPECDIIHSGECTCKVEIERMDVDEFEKLQGSF